MRKKQVLMKTKFLRALQAERLGAVIIKPLAPRILDKDFAPGFYVKHFIKDMTIAWESAQKMGMRAPGLELSLSLYKELAEMGEGNAGTQALYQLYEKKFS